jgi:hypothetical protein
MVLYVLLRPLRPELDVILDSSREFRVDPARSSRLMEGWSSFRRFRGLNMSWTLGIRGRIALT